jgi:hypothetical protein
MLDLLAANDAVRQKMDDRLALSGRPTQLHVANGRQSATRSAASVARRLLIGRFGGTVGESMRPEHVGGAAAARK